MGRLLLQPGEVRGRQTRKHEAATTEGAPEAKASQSPVRSCGTKIAKSFGVDGQGEWPRRPTKLRPGKWRGCYAV
jgi:hypothetical protein